MAVKNSQRFAEIERLMGDYFGSIVFVFHCMLINFFHLK